jgi:hypothetical protein
MRSIFDEKETTMKLSGIWNAMRAAWQWMFSRKGLEFLGSVEAQVAAIVTKPQYLEIAESIAKLAGQRTWSELLDTAKLWKVESGIYEGMAAGDVMRVILRSVLKRYLPGTTALVLNLAVEALAAAVKARKL